MSLEIIPATKPKPTNELVGKVCLITGATAGIGKVTALEFAKRGATVVIVARSRQRGKPAQRFLREESGNEEIDLLYGDLSSLASIRQVVDTFLAKRSRLDILVNNAAIVPMTRELSLDGYEMQFAVNHLAPFYLTGQLLNILKSTVGSRVVNVSSEAHQRAKLNFHNLQSEIKYSTFNAYGMSKLENVYFTYSLAKRLEGTGVSVNALHPGVIRSELIRQMPIWYEWIFNCFAKKTEAGSETPLYVATSEELSGVSGKYFSAKKEIRSSALSYDSEIGERLWDLSETLVGLRT